MGRLTERKEDRYFENEEFWVDAQQPSIDKIDDVYFKLAEFEDFMEENGFNNLEDLKNKINSWVDEAKAKKLAEETIKNYLKSIDFQKQINDLTMYKVMWQKLKELLKKHIEHNQKEYDGSFYVEFQHYSACENWVLDRMQELEDNSETNVGGKGDEL